MADAPPMEVMVRTYAGQNQPEAASLFAADALMVTYQRSASRPTTDR
jgi:hypothetical protein